MSLTLALPHQHRVMALLAAVTVLCCVDACAAPAPTPTPPGSAEATVAAAVDVWVSSRITGTASDIGAVATLGVPLNTLVQAVKEIEAAVPERFNWLVEPGLGTGIGARPSKRQEEIALTIANAALAVGSPEAIVIALIAERVIAPEVEKALEERLIWEIGPPGQLSGDRMNVVVSFELPLEFGVAFFRRAYTLTFAYDLVVEGGEVSEAHVIPSLVHLTPSG